MIVAANSAEGDTELPDRMAFAQRWRSTLHITLLLNLEFRQVCSDVKAIYRCRNALCDLVRDSERNVTFEGGVYLIRT